MINKFKKSVLGIVPEAELSEVCKAYAPGLITAKIGLLGRSYVIHKDNFGCFMLCSGKLSQTVANRLGQLTKDAEHSLGPRYKDVTMSKDVFKIGNIIEAYRVSKHRWYIAECDTTYLHKAKNWLTTYADILHNTGTDIDIRMKLPASNDVLDTLVETTVGTDQDVDPVVAITDKIDKLKDSLNKAEKYKETLLSRMENKKK